VIAFWSIGLFLTLHVSADTLPLYDVLKQPLSSVAREQPVVPDTQIDSKAASYPIGPYHPPLDYSPQNIRINDHLSLPHKKTIEDTLYLQSLMLSSIALLALMPESLTNWNAAKLEEKPLSERWKNHTGSKPVWDDDHWAINYIGHPVSGAWYYTMGRNDGLSIGESAAFSAILSTFFWEYGYEAFAETPSIQDLIVTPVAGSLLGEGMIVLQKKLDKQGGVLWGSETLGDISYFLIDPLGNIAYWMKNSLSSLGIHAEVTMTFQTYPYAAPPGQTRRITPAAEMIPYHEREYGFLMRFH
jgi:hypothetical protein